MARTYRRPIEQSAKPRTAKKVNQELILEDLNSDLIDFNVSLSKQGRLKH